MPTSDGPVHFLPFQKERGEDGGAKPNNEWSLQMRVFVFAGEQVHQGGSAVRETDQSGKRFSLCGWQAAWLAVCLVKLKFAARGVTQHR